MERVLVLNASYEPLSFISVRRAVILLLREKAEALETDISRHLRAERVAVPVPLVIRLVTYVRIPYRLTVPLTRRSLLSRDGHACQYCGTPDGPLTVDHVVPRSRGGQTTWENCVIACMRCNHRKGNRTPEEAGLRLSRPPRKPAYVAVAILGEARGNDVWQRYVQP
jgi:5-methylcytosine-specific restriction endonuclease McrA